MKALRAPSLKADTISYSIDDVPALTGWTRTQVYGLIKSGSLLSYKMGRRRIIPCAAIEEVQARLLKGEVL